MPADLIGAVLDGRYEIVEQVAEGAMGVVYRGERIKLGRAVAIKFLHPWNAEDAAARKRFEVEARAMARLEHPNCAAVIDVGEYEGAPYVVMEFVRGTTLRDVLDEQRLSPMRVADIMRQILSGLAHAHELGIVHRDIKPANVMLTDKIGLGDVVKILDFGLARLRGGSGGLTVGMAIGTPSYMAPEQASGGTVDARTDLYACGVLLFEMLTGRKPFVADEPLDVLRMHREAPPPRLADVLSDPDLAPFEPVVAQALAKRPDDRFASAAAFSAALEDATRVPAAASVRAPAPAAVSAPTTAPPPPAAAGRRRSLVLMVAAIGAVALIGIVAAVVSSGGHGPAPSDAAMPVATPHSADAGEPEADVLARARALLDGGDDEGALQLLQGARRTFPDRATIPYEMGRIYFARLWWRDGLEQLRAAIHLDPAYRTDPELIKTVLRGFITTPDTNEDLAAFLHDDVGDAAVPYLQETAQSHPSPKVRARASALLQRYH